MTLPGKLHANTYFIADLHLDPERKEALEFSLKFFEQVHSAHALYILGDLFEYWIGDDAGIMLYRDVIDALASVSAAGCQLFVMLGNRDFLLGEAFAAATGATLVTDDELLINIDGDALLLMHGDTLCIDDTDYQSFRKQVRDSTWQAEFLSQGIDQRLAYAAHLRDQSRKKSAGKSDELMDVNTQQVHATMDASHCSVLIHGHTHRPDVHTDEARNTTRLVVGDWHEQHALYVVKNESGFELRNFRGTLDTPAPSV